MSSMTTAELATRFRPALWPSVAAVLGVALLVSLGTWQLERLAWKEALIAHVEAGLAQPAIDLPADLADPAALDYRPVRARGRFLPDAAFAFGVSARDGEPGARLVMPLLLADGRTLLVDRGWLPQDLLPPALPKDLRSPVETVVEGVARHHGEHRRSYFQPADDPARGRWFGWDLPAMAEAVGRPLLPIVMVAAPSPDAAPGSLPQPAPVRPAFTNNHLGYAITWYGLAAALAGVYLAASLKKEG
jgi:surfeit locus 1 family protein